MFISSLDEAHQLTLASVEPFLASLDVRNVSALARPKSRTVCNPSLAFARSHKNARANLSREKAYDQIERRDGWRIAHPYGGMSLLALAN